MRQQLRVEDYYCRLAQMQEKDVIVVTDRGVLDPIAYTSEEIKQKIFTETEDLLWENLVISYDMVLHLVTAANGADKYYTLDNNFARTEGVKEAIAIDDKLQEVYNGAHNHL